MEIAPAGSYTLVPSTFVPKEEGDFSLSISSNMGFDIELIPQEGAGMYSRTLTGNWQAAPPSRRHLPISDVFSLVLGLRINREGFKIQFTTPLLSCTSASSQTSSGSHLSCFVRWLTNVVLFALAEYACKRRRSHQLRLPFIYTPEGPTGQRENW